MEKARAKSQKDNFKKQKGGLGRSAPAREARSPAGTPSEVDKAEADATFERALAAVKGGVPKGIVDPAAYAAQVKASKFGSLVRELNEWASASLNGAARFAAWEVLAEAERAGGRSGMAPAARKDFDRLVGMMRKWEPAKEAAD